MNRLKTFLTLSILLGILAFFSTAQAEVLKPFILGNTVSGTMSEAVNDVTAKLTEQGFTVIGTYSPYPNATVICASYPDLTEAAAKAKNGGFGAASSSRRPAGSSRPRPAW